MFIKKFFRVRSLSLSKFFKVFGGLKFKFEVLNVLIIKVNVLVLNYGYFRVY